MIITSSLPQSLAAKMAAKSIPIIFWTGADPAATGLVESLRHPGGNLTGASVLNFPAIVKRDEVLHELVPGVRLVAYLTNPNNQPSAEAETEKLQVAARALALSLLVENARDPREFEGAVSSLVKKSASALGVSGDALFFSNRLIVNETWHALLSARRRQRERTIQRSGHTDGILKAAR